MSISLLIRLMILSTFVARMVISLDTETYLFEQFSTTGNKKALTDLLAYRTPEEISAKLKALPAVKVDERPAVLLAEKLSGSAYESYDYAQLVEDSEGNVHVAFVERHVEKIADYMDNRETWVTTLYYVEKRNGEWLKPVRVYGNGIYINGLRLLIDDRDQLHLLWHGHNLDTKMTPYALAPGEYTILLSSREKQGTWSEPEGCLNEYPKLMNGFDAVWHANEIHLVWQHWTTNYSRVPLIYRRLNPKGWADEVVLPLATDRNLSNPVIRILNGKLNIFAAGQTPDANRIGVFRLTRSSTKWSKPKLIVDKTYFDLRSTRPSERLLLFLPVFAAGGSALMLFKSTDRSPIRVMGRFSFPDVEFDNAVPLAISWPKHGEPHAIVGWDRNLILVRQSTENSWQSACIAKGIAGRPDDLLVNGNSFHAVVTTSANSDRLLYVAGHLPESSWDDSHRLTARLRAGIGLTIKDFVFLRKHVLQQGLAAEKKSRVMEAFKHYLYVTRNFENGDEIPAAWYRLEKLYSSADTELQLLLLTYAQFYPELLFKISLWQIPPQIPLPPPPREFSEKGGRLPVTASMENAYCTLTVRAVLT